MGILHHARMAQVQRVAAAGPVNVVAVLPDPIIATVIDSAQGEGGAFNIDLGAVVQDDIEDHLNTGFVQRFDRLAKLLQGAVRIAGVARIEGKHRQRVVAPVVA